MAIYQYFLSSAYSYRLLRHWLASRSDNEIAHKYYLRIKIAIVVLLPIRVNICFRWVWARKNAFTEADLSFVPRRSSFQWGPQLPGERVPQVSLTCVYDVVPPRELSWRYLWRRAIKQTTITHTSVKWCNREVIGLFGSPVLRGNCPCW